MTRVTMGLYKVSGADGYDYLTNQVASGDELRLRGEDPADWYARSGEPPGQWMGAGCGGAGVAGEVGAAEMRGLWVQACSGRRTARAVAGFDLTFTPVKSVSTLWAVATSVDRAVIEEAHRAAVAETIGWLERDAVFTRTGHAGVRRVRTCGLVVAAFEHRTSRTGDPNLHTHAAVLNRVQAVDDGQWRTLYGQALYRAVVTASEMYNARLEDQLRTRLGFVFHDVPRAAPGLRPVREVVGVPAELLAAFSARRAQIEAKYEDLAAAYTAASGLDPARSTRVDDALHQWATLATRPGRKVSKSLAARVEEWRARAVKVLGLGGIERMWVAVRSAAPRPDPRAVEEITADIRARVLLARARPSVLHVRAETERQIRAWPDAAGGHRTAVVDLLQEGVMGMVGGPVSGGDTRSRVEALALLGARIRAARAPSRVEQALGAAQEFFAGEVSGSWVPEYLRGRGLTVADAGFAPGRVSLVTHLRGRGFTDDEVVAAGLAARSERGVVYDFFRDRMTLPYRAADGRVLGFTTRQPPGVTNPNNPKYLNSPETVVFRKREVLFGLDPAGTAALRAGRDVLIVEGPLDAAAVNQADRFRTVVAVAPCGTAFTAGHVKALQAVVNLTGRQVVVGMDCDPAGRAAAAAVYPLLVSAGVIDPRVLAPFPEGVSDPADVLQRSGAAALVAGLAERGALADVVVDRVLAGFPRLDWAEHRVQALWAVVPVIAAMPDAERDRQIGRVSPVLRVDAPTISGKVSRHRQVVGLPERPVSDGFGGYARTPVTVAHGVGVGV